MMGRKKPIQAIGDVLQSWQKQSGISKRLEQAEVVARWADLVGPQIASVTECESISPEGSLRVRVATAPWAQELKLMTPSIIARINAGRKGRITEIRWFAAPLERREP